MAQQRTRTRGVRDAANSGWAFELSPMLERKETARLAPPDPAMPERRRLRVYAQDPALSFDDGAIYTVSIPMSP